MVEWAPSAVRDAGTLLSELPEVEAGPFYEQVLRIAKDLARRDAVSGIVPELKDLGLFAYREIDFGPFSLFFRLEGSHINILGVLDRRRDLREVLFRRMLLSL